MNDSSLLVVAMAEQCRDRIAAAIDSAPDLPQALHPRHLSWMCDQVIQHAGSGKEARLHRWIGFIQCGMMANRIIDFEGAKSMFDAAKNAHDGIEADDDLIDHLDPENAYGLDIGGEG